MLEPTTMRGPCAVGENMWADCSSQREMVPSTNSPPEAPWPE